MAVIRPYPHIYRQGSVEPYHELRDAPVVANFMAAYDILKEDLQRIFQFVEPVEANFGVFSHRIFELLLRACTEVEALCKMVFAQNGHHLSHREANIIRYSDLEAAMRLSGWVITCKYLKHVPFAPFSAFTNEERSQRSPEWYRAYNSVKHDRARNFSSASLLHLIHAVGAVYVMLAAQVGPHFDHTLRLTPSYMGFVVSSLYSIVSVPEWPDDEKYEFSWETLKEGPEPFQMHPLPTRP